MTTHHSLLALSLTAIAVLTASSALADGATATSSVAVNVGTFRNQKGILGCRLYDSGANFPEGSKGAVEKRVTITSATVRCDFENVPAGTYAVSVMHDENDNRKLDKNFLGIPSEGYGVSNNHTHALSAPTWAESKFVVERGKNVGLSIGLRY